MRPAALLTTNVVGGLGNQLFLIANLLATTRRTGIPAFVEPAAFSSSAEAPRPTYWTSLFRELDQHGIQLTSTLTSSSALPVVNVPEMRPVRKIELDPQRACVYKMIGFFQSATFFDDYPVLLRGAIPADLWRVAHGHLRRHYRSDMCHTVALHVRRGDYTRFRDIFEQLEVDYYDTAVRQLLGGLLSQQAQQASQQSFETPSAGLSSPTLHLLLFCDELRVAQTMAGYFRVKYRGLRVSVVSPELEEGEGHAFGIEGRDTLTSAALPREVLELLMMAQCNDVVMANSTFSWWGAYFNHVPLRRVIAPSKWFVKDPYPASNHLYCPGWMLI